MRTETLEELKTAFDDWRSKKRHARERIPDELLEEARRMIGVHGREPVVRATRARGTRLTKGRRIQGKSGASTRIPSFSRVELTAPTTTNRPFAEVETPNGVKVRIFAQSGEVFSLLSSLCQVGGGR